jgi:ribosomal protein S1
VRSQVVLTADQARKSSPQADAAKYAPAPFPPGSQQAIIVGNPKNAEAYIIRVKLAKGTKVAPHTHPNDENVTVISGTFHIGVGEKFDAVVTQVDAKARKVSVSIKAMEIADEKEAVAQYGSTDSGASLGDILGAALNKAKGDEDDEPAKPKRKRTAKGDAEADSAPEE